MSNRRLENALSKAQWLLLEVTDPDHRQMLTDLIADIEAGIEIQEQRIDDMRLWSIRNPGFDGDMVGRPDDDFFDDDDDDDDDTDQG